MCLLLNVEIVGDNDLDFITVTSDDFEEDVVIVENDEKDDNDGEDSNLIEVDDDQFLFDMGLGSLSEVVNNVFFVLLQFVTSYRSQ
jgi:hypothetical protein